jgi:NitT/TauT family transport system permease protein
LIVLPVVTALMVLGCWEAVVRIKNISNALLPAPSAVAVRLMETLPFLLRQAVPTTLETIASFLISLVLGIGLAVLICKSRLVRDALYPNIVLFQLIPKIALAPLFIVWLGIGSTSRVTFGVFISFFPVVVATLTGLTSVDRDLLRLCKAVGAHDAKVYAKVRFPAAVPHLFSGLKIAITFAMIGVIVGEFITAQAGLGYMILFAASQAEMTLIFASIVVLCVIGLVLYGLVVMAETLALKKYGA